jgi:hypothetical protein
MRPLEDTLTRTLTTKAAQVDVAVPGDGAADGFDPTRRHPGLGVFDGDPSPRSRRLLAAAAIVLVVALVGGAVLASRRGGDGDGVSAGAAPEGWLVPTWVPDGMELWSADWYDPPVPVAAENDWCCLFQLYGDPDDERAMYVQTSPDPDRALPEGVTLPGEPVTVRGVEGRIGAAVDVPEPVDQITWSERGATVTALYKGLSSTEALEAVEQLDWRSASPADGFAATGLLELRGESLRREPGRSTQLLYGDGVPNQEADAAGPLFVISTSVRGGLPLGYLEVWFYDGGPAAADGSRHAYEADHDTLGVYWPDGREAYLAALNDVPIGEATMERIVASLVVEDGEADLAPLRSAADANVGSLPVLASTEVDVGTLEIHGDGGYRRLCLRQPGRNEPDCGDGTGGMGLGSPDEARVTGSWDLDGTWYVAVATIGAAPEIHGDRGEDSDDDPLPGTTATAGDWQIRFVRPPAAVGQVNIPTTGGFDGIGRPY